LIEGFVEGLTAVKVRGKHLNSNIGQVKSERIINLKRFYFAFPHVRLYNVKKLPYGVKK